MDRSPALRGGADRFPGSLDIRVDGRAYSKLSGVQRVGALQGDYDVTIGVPLVLGEILLHTVREQRCCAVFIASEVAEVGRTQLHYVVVGCQLSTPGQLANVDLTFTQQRLRHLLGHDVATEHACERVAHEVLKLAVQPLSDAHGYLLPRSCSWVDRIRVRPGGQCDVQTRLPTV